MKGMDHAMEKHSDEICKSYAGYLDVKSVTVMAHWEDEIDSLQKSMDELYTTLLIMQGLNQEVISQKLDGYLEKAKDLETIFKQIDAIYTTMSTISCNLGELEASANLIDKHMHNTNPLKKMFGFFKTSNEIDSTNIKIPTVFKADNIFQVSLEHGEGT